MTYFLQFISKPRVLALVSALAISVYLMMVFGTLAQIEQMAEARPFDLRPTGYTYDEANGLLLALGKAGREIYLTRQIPLDTVYPALFALAISGTLYALLGYLGIGRRWRNIACVIPAIAAIADNTENALIFAMLLKWPDISPEFVTIVSLATLFKSSFVTVSFLMVTLAGTGALWKWVLGR